MIKSILMITWMMIWMYY